MSDIFSRLRAAYSFHDDAVPKGYRSMRQIAGHWRMSIPNATRIVRASVDRGLLAKLDLKVGGKRVPHYGPPRKKR